ncbi:hypothetical protein [Verrucomicrobium sp. BvORR034]|uniref:hypothetical protein n=1 Tax=Verrucomicrobium sp. BvORR034 TaxID=1396418 RepID=UPI002240F706|nr:hypothetical protein [Verrucomicrobium sp. BvORR034]
MARPFILLTVLVASGVGAGLLMQQLQKPSSPSSRPAPSSSPSSGQTSSSNQSPEPGAELGSIPPPRLPGLDPSVDMEAPPLPGTSGSAEEVKTLQSQVTYLQEQVDILRNENSTLLDKLASLTGKNPILTPPCSPGMKSPSNEEAPDFVGIGIELVKTREIQDIPLPTLSVDRAEVENRIAAWLAKQFPPTYGKQFGRALAAVGAIPEPVDAIALKAAFLSHQIGGWFDQESQTLLMAEHGSERENALALAYGYLFKHYGKAVFPAETKPLTLDQRLARESLLAGDASLTRFLHALRHPDKGGGGGVGEDPDDPSRAVPIPNFLRELELLPFGMGFDFMQSMHSIGSWEQVNATYDRLPTASAEILDPQLYLAEEPFRPLTLHLPEKKIAGAAPVWEDTMGPLGMVLLLKQHVAEPIAAGTAPGWANDTWLTYSAGEGTQRDHAVWQTLWKDSNAADAFFSAMRTGLLSRYKGATPSAKAAKGVFQLDGPERFVVMERTHNGQGVLFIDAATEAFARAAEKTLLTPSNSGK